MLLFSTFIVALAITMALVPPLMKVAERLSVVDMPNERKVHSSAIPRIGGVAMSIGAIVPILLWVPLTPELGSLLAGLVILLAFGVWDDCSDLDYRLKFLGQIAAASVVVVAGGVSISVLPFLGFEPVSVYVSVPLTIIFLVGATNAVNLSDGLDGLAAGVSLLSLCGVALLAYVGGGQYIILICFTVAGVILGFLRYNTFPARVFMGDTGSQFLGFVVGVLAVILTQKVNTALNPLLPLFLLGLPVIDTVFVMTRRVLEGRSPFSPDKNHIHHQLLDLGLAHYEAVGVIYLTQITFIVSAILLRYETDTIVALVYVGLSGILLAALLLAQRRQWTLKHSGFTNFMVALNRCEWVHKFSIVSIQCGVILYLVAGAAASRVASIDLRVSALFILVVLLARLAWAERLRFFPLRLLVYPAIAFTVYIMHNDAQALELIPIGLRTGLLAGLLILMLFAVRYTKSESFQATPTDLLVIAVAGGVGVLYQQHIVDIELIPVMVGIIILFYAAELVMRQMKTSWNCFTVGMVTALAFLSIRLIV
jgi:UDP-GlcNAc:undecaprenyl-phosphate/decaprenyl-phosphate GlcNAc-1-phosphate transferase